MSGWLDKLAIGNEVATACGIGTSRYSLHRVTHATATKLVIDDGSEWQRKNGRRRGATSYGYGERHLVEPTDFVRAEMERARLLASVERVKWSALPTEILRRVVAALKETP